MKLKILEQKFIHFKGPKFNSPDIETIKEWWIDALYANARLERIIKELRKHFKTDKELTGNGFKK